MRGVGGGGGLKRGWGEFAPTFLWIGAGGEHGGGKWFSEKQAVTESPSAEQRFPRLPRHGTCCRSPPHHPQEAPKPPTPLWGPTRFRFC